MISSGTTSISTSSASAVTLIGSITGTYASGYIVNTSGITGEFSIDNGGTWHLWPTGVYSMAISNARTAILFKRKGATDVTGLSAYLI